MKKRGNILISLIFGIIFLIGVVNASFNVSNITIDKTYSPNDQLRGNLVLGFNKEPGDNKLSAFSSNITLLEFLRLNYANFTCIPIDCLLGYSSTSGGVNSKTIKLDKTKIIGLRLTGPITAIRNLSFELSSDVQQSCKNPLQINVFDDSEIEWKATKVSRNNYSCNIDNNYGCFNDAGINSNTSIKEGYVYCENIRVYPSKGYYIGAEVIGSGSANFKLTFDGGEQKECKITINSGGIVSCYIELDSELTDYSTVQVCLIPNGLGGNIYSIKHEEKSPCGTLKSPSGDEYPNYDFNIFAKSLRYDLIPSSKITIDEIAKFGSANIVDDIYNYISTRYEGNCTPECIIPIAFSGIPQNVEIKKMVLEYDKDGRPLTEDNIYEIKKTSPTLSAPTQKYDLSKANLLVPYVKNGTRRAAIQIGDRTIYSEDIKIKQGIVINDVIPNDVAMLVPFRFAVLMESMNNSYNYKWNFGDGTLEETSNNNSIRHVYDKMGSYDLKVTVTNGYDSTTRTVTVNVGSPKNYINNTVKEYKENIRIVQGQIMILPDWIKAEIKKKVDVDEILIKVNDLDRDYKENAIEDEDYAKIMESLALLKVPIKFGQSNIIESSQIFPDQKNIDFEILSEMGAGSVKESDKEDYIKQINTWVAKNIKLTLESKNYNFYYKNRKEGEKVFTYAKYIIEPINSLDNLYMTFNLAKDDTILNTQLKTAKIENKEVIAFSLEEPSESMTIEYLNNEELDIENLPISISPKFNKCCMATIEPECNNNRKCESGETSENCSNDCKNFGSAFILFIVLLIGAFIVYIILQEWYKRYYESHLFKDKNQLYNLINFMSVSENQGQKKKEIFDKVKKFSWSNEQLEYAWNKLHGKKTGMFEIPLFSIFEKKHVKDEIKKIQDNKGNTPKKV